MLARDVHDPGIGFVTITACPGDARPAARAHSLHGARGRQGARQHCEGARSRVGFLRRQIGSRLRLRRVPELEFLYDESIAGQDRIEQLLNNIRGGGSGGAVTPDPTPDDDDQS